MCCLMYGCKNKEDQPIHRIWHTQPMHPLVDGSYAYLHKNESNWYYVSFDSEMNIIECKVHKKSPYELGIKANTNYFLLQKTIDENISINADNTYDGILNFEKLKIKEKHEVILTSTEHEIIKNWEHNGGTFFIEDLDVSKY